MSDGVSDPLDAVPSLSGGGPIVFDGAVLAAAPHTGVALSFLHTLGAYLAEPARECVLWLPEGAAAPPLELRIVRAPRRALARRLALPGHLRRLRASLLHSPVAALPFTCPCPMIATIHDLPWRSPVPLPEPRLVQRLAVRHAGRRAAALLVPSRATRADLLAELPAAAARVHVVAHGVPGQGASAATTDAGASGPFLVIGADRPRKNLARVRRAHALAAAAEPTLPALDLVGPGLGYVSEAEKHDRLAHARGLLHLSLFEGFGLPVLEAFTHGVPVLCSNLPCLTELADGAALHADPLDVAAIAAAILRLHRDEALRAALRRRGLERARRFTPAASAAAWRRIHDALLP